MLTGGRERTWRIRWIRDGWCDKCDEHISGLGARKNGKTICPGCYERLTGRRI